MKWTTVHKALCIAALSLVASLVLIDILLNTDNSGLQILGNSAVIITLVCAVYICWILSLVFAYRYAVVQQPSRRLFITAIILLSLIGLMLVPFSIENIADWLSPPKNSFLNNFNLFDISDFRKQLLLWQERLIVSVTVLHLLVMVSLIRQRVVWVRQQRSPRVDDRGSLTDGREQAVDS